MIEHTQVLIASLKCSLNSAQLSSESVLRDAGLRRDAALAEAAMLVIVAKADAHGRKTIAAHVKMSFAAAPIAVVLGAHPLCDVPNVHGASLRHVVLVTDPQENAGWVTAVDLNTPDGMTVDGERAIRRVDARSSLRFQAGSADVFVMSLLPGQRIDAAAIIAWLSLPPLKALVDAVAPALLALEKQPRNQPAQLPRPISRNVTRELVTLVAPLSKESGVLFLKPTDADLRVGLLLGRYDRCASRIDDGLVSRVHVLVLARRNGQLLVIDAASTNGTEVSALGAPPIALGVVKRAALVRRGARLSIGGSVVEIA